MSALSQPVGDRFCSPTQPVKVLMKDGAWLDKPEEVPVTTVIPPKWNNAEPPLRRKAPELKRGVQIMGSKPSEWKALFEKLAALPAGGMLGVEIPTDEKPGKFVNRFRSNMASNNRTSMFKWCVAQSQDKRKAIVIKIGDRRSGILEELAESHIACQTSNMPAEAENAEVS